MAVLALAVASFLLLLLVFWLWRRTRRLGRRIDALTRGEEGKDLGEILDAHLDKVFAVSREVDELAVRTAVVEANLRRSFQRIGLVRFNPFEDTGGNQSFALALLDADGDGWVVSAASTPAPGRGSTPRRSTAAGPRPPCPRRRRTRCATRWQAGLHERRARPDRLGGTAAARCSGMAPNAPDRPDP